jgi:hypothetical protein
MMKIGLQREWNYNAKEEVKLEWKVLYKKEVAFTLLTGISWILFFKPSWKRKL